MIDFFVKISGRLRKNRIRSYKIYLQKNKNCYALAYLENKTVYTERIRHCSMFGING